MPDKTKVAKLYQCPECGLHYIDEQIAKKCEAWCIEQKSCNLEITRFSAETTSNRWSP